MDMCIKIKLHFWKPPRNNLKLRFCNIRYKYKFNQLQYTTSPLYRIEQILLNI